MPSTQRTQSKVRYKHIILTSKWERLCMESADFEAALGALPEGYSEGVYEGRRYDVILRRSDDRSEEHTSELQSLMRISYAVFCLKTKKIYNKSTSNKEIMKQ